jgi:Domain of unknown function DUF29
MASRAEQLYREDFYAWTRQQAAALRRLADERWKGPLDLLHLAEEAEDLAAQNPRTGWFETIIDARTEIEDKITPTIRRGLLRRLPQLWQQARRNTAAALRLRGEHTAAEALPLECPYRLADLLRHDWYPQSRHGLEP